ncbi:hypothetical protein EVAR_53819_1 [Eumeta japonica]|uniref:Uncharacterized protein n=1 Tax=Eumeta variegata TaxID=151549 RepID=A0A4C1YR87_EUMVA|nr:hypothetical protein EVAR_53819_1 [Eumeta japonica]
MSSNRPTDLSIRDRFTAPGAISRQLGPTEISASAIPLYTSAIGFAVRMRNNLTRYMHRTLDRPYTVDPTRCSCRTNSLKKVGSTFHVPKKAETIITLIYLLIQPMGRHRKNRCYFLLI